MTSSNALPQARLFRFSVPELDAALAIPIDQMVSVARLSFVTRVPCTPPSILGLGRWQDAPTVIIDLRLILDPDAQPDNGRNYADYHHVIIKIAFENQISLVGCPILAGGQMVSVPLSLPKAELPVWITSEAIHQAVLIEDTPVLLLDMMRLPALLAPLQLVV
jgi:chemotaxis signal transduction protein